MANLLYISHVAKRNKNKKVDEIEVRIITERHFVCFVWTQIYCFPPFLFGLNGSLCCLIRMFHFFCVNSNEFLDGDGDDDESDEDESNEEDG